MQFRVKAVGRQSEVVSLAIEASDMQAALENVRQQGLSILTIHTNRIPSGQLLLSRKFPTILFSQELLALLAAGLALVEALETLVEKQAHPDHRRILDNILNLLYEGRTFSAALGQFPQHFPLLYVATVRASEKTGDLPQALGRYIAYREQIDGVRKKVIASSIYPALLMIVGILVLLFLMFYVVPRFSQVYEDMSTNPPFFSRLLLTVGQVVGNHGWTILTTLACTVITAGYALTRTSTRARAIALLWRIPAIGFRMKLYELSRLYRTLGMLLRGGIPITQAAEMSSGLLGAESQKHLLRAIQVIREGQSITAAIQAEGLTTPVATRMLSVGERTGNMGEMMDRIAAFYDDDLSRWMDWFMRLFEPLLMVGIGLAVGLIVVLMYMPIFELADSIQ